MKIKRTGSFVAQDDAGLEHTIFIDTKYKADLEIGQRLTTKNKREVSRIQKGAYRLIDGMIVRSDDPNAP